MGVDPGLERVGMAGISVFDGTRYSWEHKTLEKAGSRDQFLATVAKDVEEYAARFQPEVVAIEQEFFGWKGKKAFGMREVRLAVMLGLDRLGYRSGESIVMVTPTKVKKVACGNGAGTKDDVRAGLEKILGYRLEGKADGIDALGCALAVAADRLGLSLAPRVGVAG
jgi:Holliday junction resolvasome RuvABC endonuclease subunit